MDDRLPLAVGKIILAWGRLDQYLHTLIRAAERALGDEPAKEGRFTERRKLMRRLCLRLASNNDGYMRSFDRWCAKLVKLERQRGRIAHGYAGETDDGAHFFDVPEAMDPTIDKAESALANNFSYEALSALENDIELASSEMINLGLNAFALWKQGNAQAPSP